MKEAAVPVKWEGNAEAPEITGQWAMGVNVTRQPKQDDLFGGVDNRRQRYLIDSINYLQSMLLTYRKSLPDQR